MEAMLASSITSEPTGIKLDKLCPILILTHTPVFNLDTRHPLQSITKIFGVGDLLAAQDNQLRDLIENVMFIPQGMAIGHSHVRSRYPHRIPKRNPTTLQS